MNRNRRFRIFDEDNNEVCDFETNGDDFDRQEWEKDNPEGKNDFVVEVDPDDPNSVIGFG
jgi:hypothetical protein